MQDGNYGSIKERRFPGKSTPSHAVYALRNNRGDDHRPAPAHRLSENATLAHAAAVCDNQPVVDRYVDRHADAHTGLNPYADRHADVDTDANVHTDRYRDAHRYRDTHGIAGDHFW